MSKAEAQHFAEHRRKRDIDEVAVGLRLAYPTKQHGICYFDAHPRELFRKGYEAGLSAPRGPQDLAQIRFDKTPVARYVAYRPCGCFQGFTTVGSPDDNNSASFYVGRWVREGCIVKPLPADAFYSTDRCPVHAQQKGG